MLVNRDQPANMSQIQLKDAGHFILHFGGLAMWLIHASSLTIAGKKQYMPCTGLKLPIIEWLRVALNPVGARRNLRSIASIHCLAMRQMYLVPRPLRENEVARFPETPMAGAAAQINDLRVADQAWQMRLRKAAQ